jgi:hypothetical protein
MDQPHPSHGHLSAARRRLIRGALAAPAVMTVCSGSAFAAASNMRCLANATAPGNEITVTVYTSNDPAALDGFVRVRLYTKGSSNGAKYYLRGSDLGANVASGSGLPGTGEWQEFDLKAGSATENRLVGDKLTSQPGGTALSDKYAGVRFNANGEISGVGDSGSGSALGTSCWNSFAGVL